MTAVTALQVLSAQLARSHPRGVQAILIGLLLPAIQRVVEPGAADTDSLRSNLSANGGEGFLMEGDVVYPCQAGRLGHHVGAVTAQPTPFASPPWT